MRYLKIIQLVICFFLFVNGLWAQTTKFYSTERGLSSSMINQIYQDKRGFIWIATEDGLNRFDGNKFVTYRKITNDSTSLKNNYVRTLFEDSKGNLWIGCLDGLMKYDRNSDSFHEIKAYDQNGVRLFPHVVSIIERRNGEIWLTTSGSGILSLKTDDLDCHTIPDLNERLCSRFLTCLIEDSFNRIWIGSENDGLNVYFPATDKVDLYSLSSPENYQLNGDAISAICEDKQGTIFVGSLSGGLNRLDVSCNCFKVISEQTNIQSKILPVKSLMVDEKNRLYVGTDGKGMKIYNSQKRVLENYEPFSTPFDFSKTKVHSIIEDKDGNVWAGVFQKGIFFIPGNPNGFKYYGYKSFRKNSIGSNCVMSVHKDKKGIIWIGTDNDGLYAIDEHSELVKHYENSDNPTSVPNTIMCIVESSDGKLWLGSYLNGFALFDEKTGECTYYKRTQKDIIFNSRVYCMIDDQKGNLWIGTYGGGLYKFNIATQTIIEHYYQHNEGDDGISNNWINSLILDKQNRLWIGTYKGLSCLDLNSNSFFSYFTNNSKLPSNIIFSLKEDLSGNIWIGTNEGLACLNNETKEINVFNNRNGSVQNIICAIENDENNNIWVSTLSGLSKYSPRDKSFTNYYISDGLQGSEFSRGAHFKSEDGEIFFGGINGVTCFYSKDIHSKTRMLDVFITDFYLFGKPVHTGQKSGQKLILNRFLPDESQISLASHDNVFSIELSTLEYSNPEGISYRYRLENFDTDWTVMPPGNNRIIYTNINPGKYKLMFQATDKENTSDIKTVLIIIRSPWYQTWWMKMIYVCLFFLLLFAIYSYIRSRIRNKNEMLRLEHADQINEAKLQFFINISHEIRTPMTLIMGPLEKLLANNKNFDLQQSYLLIYRNAQRILRLINQLMDIRKIDRGQMTLKSRETDMVGFIKDIMQAFEYTAKKKDIRFEFRREMPELKVWIDLNNFDKVLFNVFSNAFKYTPSGGEITVYLKTGQNDQTQGPLKYFFEIQVLDSGIGIDEDKIERIFERFYQVDNGVTSSNFGTGIGLHLSRSLVELQHGVIFAENRKDAQGSSFTICLPMGKSHLKADEVEIISETTPLATFDYARKDDLFEPLFEESAEPITNKAKTKYRILIAEDDPEINNYVKNELSSDYRIIQCVNGKEALDTILKEKPDLVISDVMMPEMDGMMLCRKIKSNINTDHIPVILLTAKSQDEDRAEGLDIGADAYIVKPFNPELLKKTISNLLSNRERLKGKFSSQSEGKIEKMEIKSSDEILMEKVLAIINKNINNPDLNVEMLSSGVGMSRVHMYRKLKELTNSSARDFIRNIRLKQAGKLLLSKKLSISEVAYAVGFSTLSHFSSSFRDFYGMSPKDYIEQNEGKE